MRFHQLNIETRRERPARARSEGESLLIRAGYLDSEGGLSELGRRTIARLEGWAARGPESLSDLGLGAMTTADAEVVAIDPAGPLEFLRCPNCGYAASAATVRAKREAPPAETPLPLERVATPDCKTIDALAAFLGIPKSRTAKALLYVRADSDQLVFVVIRGDTQLNEVKLQSEVGALQPATAEQIVAAGAVPGYASPIGVQGALVIVDELIPASPNLVAGANEAGFHLRNVNCGRDYVPDEVADLTAVVAGDPCPQCASPLHLDKAFVLVDHSGPQPMSILQALAEKCHDQRGLMFPPGGSAFDVYLMNLAAPDTDTRGPAAEIAGQLEQAGIAVLLDDRDERAGVKFNDADLIGCPFRVTVGAKRLADRMVELKRRSDGSEELIPMDAIVEKLHSLTLPAK